ncbi:hypothetical protein [Crocinitomix catalasitica]|uniref:hypothetical protein n=1 Tax=Crocinitomix catalasitica TaxID=184607 RepID=UPI0012FA8709|nr:hypothetical protein [Crocinitomix catalasitica]
MNLGNKNIIWGIGTVIVVLFIVGVMLKFWFLSLIAVIAFGAGYALAKNKDGNNDKFDF